MNKLIAELRKEHAQLAKALENVKEKKMITKEAKTELFNIKKLLLQHLEKEDNCIYTKLNEVAKTNKDLRKTLEIFAKDMSQITTKILAFFDNYTKDSIEDDSFIKDLSELIVILSDRIQREETIIFKKYEKVI